MDQHSNRVRTSARPSCSHAQSRRTRMCVNSLPSKRAIAVSMLFLMWPSMRWPSSMFKSSERPSSCSEAAPGTTGTTQAIRRMMSGRRGHAWNPAHGALALLPSCPLALLLSHPLALSPACPLALAPSRILSRPCALSPPFPPALSPSRALSLSVCTWKWR